MAGFYFFSSGSGYLCALVYLELRHFSQSHNQTVLDDKLMQSMLGDEALSKELKTVLVGKASGVKYPTETEEEAGPDSSDAGQQSSKEEDMKREGKI